MSRRLPRAARALALGLLGALATACGGGPGPGPGFLPVGDAVDEAGRPRRVRHEATGIELVLVDAGSYVVGTPDDEASRDGDEPRHEVALDAYYLAVTELTSAQYEAVTGEPPDSFGDAPDMPAGGISWHDAAAFVDTLGGGWSLPTEAQWEVACRAGTTTPFSFGETVTVEQVNYHGRFPYGDAPRTERRDGPLPVGSFPPNAWGFHEMHGNVWEWCADAYAWDPLAAPDDADEGASRSIRGGAWTSAGKECRSGFREGYAPNSDGAKYGLRLAHAADH